MTEKLYANRDPIALGDYYTRHVTAMTAEGLFDKHAIAEELAWRDQQIERLREQLNAPDFCWHCGDVLETEEPARCDKCPPVGECDDGVCSAMGCRDEVEALRDDE